MKRRSLILALLVISVVVNVTLAVLYFQSLTTPPSATSAAPTGKGPKVLIDSENFDFSGTGLSDESAKLPAPDLTPSPAPDAPIQIEFK